MIRLALLLFLLAGTGCGRIILVQVERLQDGDGGAAATANPALEVVVVIHEDATGFNPGDLMRIMVDGVNRTDEVKMGDEFGILRLDPAPPPGAYFVELARRTGPVFDTFTWNVAAYAGPTVASVLPTSARTGTQVTVTGAGFAGALRVFFGGAEGTVDASTATTITAIVPAGALPGLVWVLVDGDAAEGLVDFQPLDAADQPIPAPTTRTLVAAFPARGPAGTVVRLYGYAFDNLHHGDFVSTDAGRVIEPETRTLPVIGDLLCALAVVPAETVPGAGEVILTRNDTPSNALPFIVDSE